MSQTSQISTLSLLGLTLVLFLNLAVFALLRTRGPARFGLWLPANVAAGLALVAALLRGALPPALFTILYNGLVLASVCGFGITGVRMLGGRPSSALWASLGLAALAAAVLLPSPLWDLAVISAASSFVLLDSSRLVARSARVKGRRAAPGIFAVSAVLTALMLIARAAWFVAFGPDPRQASPAGFVETSMAAAVVLAVVAFDFSLLSIFMSGIEQEVREKVRELAASRGELRILLDAHDATAGILDLVMLLQKILEVVQSRLNADVVGVYMVEPDSDDMTLVAQRGLDEMAMDDLSHLSIGSSLAGQAFQRRKPAIMKTGEREDPATRMALERLGVSVVGAFPMVEGGESLGVLTIGYREGGHLGDSRIALLETLCLQLGSAMRVAILHGKLGRANERLRELASTDVLTGLANRRAALQALDREIARSKRATGLVAAIMVDLDHFKEFNDRHGHDCGDYVLANTAAIIAETVRATDIPSRWGGEEFLVVLGESEPEGATRLAERLRERIESSEWDYGGDSLRVTITLGVALCPPAAGGEALIALADEALYEGKNGGRNQVRLRVVTRLEDMPRPRGPGPWPPQAESQEEGIDGVLEALPPEAEGGLD